MAYYKLHYFAVRGRGELIRLLFTLAKVDFEDVRVNEHNTDEWLEYRHGKTGLVSTSNGRLTPYDGEKGRG
jgi:hypothetical protein